MRIAIIYATREGQTKRIVDHLVGVFRARDVAIEIFDAKKKPDPDLATYDALIVAGSVHIGSHERELVRFVEAHREELERIPTAFVSVSLSQAGVEDVERTAEQRARANQNVAGVLDAFFRKTGWQPRWIQPFAGALLYTRYNFLIRFVMKMISKKEGGSVDTSRDHEYTDWSAVERFAARIIGEMSVTPAATVDVPQLRHADPAA
jgi:menaquinone-dependent protoporphyrinogen oxidase